MVWDCWTKPEHLKQWLLGPPGWTMTVCEHELRAGTPWRKVWRKANGEEMELKGMTMEVTPPRRLVQTESWGEPWPETLNTLELSEQGGRTTITLTIRYPSKQARDAALQTGMRDGMDPSFARLDELLESLAGR